MVISNQPAVISNQSAFSEDFLPTVDPGFWSGKSVFLTGATGFKGSWLSIWLSHLGAQVTGFSLDPPTEPSLYQLAHVERQIRHIHGDIRDAEALRTSMQQAKPEIVIHMAAQTIVRQSYQDPVLTYQTNVMGVVHLLDAVRKTPSVRAVVNVTTDKCYENREWVWGYREDDPMGGYDPYSNSKGCSELITAAYRRSFFNPADYPVHGVALASARAGNVIGGGDWAADRLIPDLVRSLSAGRAIELRSPGAVRPWQFVLEPLSGYLMLAQRLFTQGPAFGEGWNFGPRDDDARSVGWIAGELGRLWGSEAAIICPQGRQPHEASVLRLDISKAAARLGWMPIWPLRKALDALVSWYKLYLSGVDMLPVCLAQIDEYMDARLRNADH